MSVTVVVGPPCAGKSDYVWRTREADELAVDFDRIAQSLGSADPHDATGDIRQAAFFARWAATQSALKADGRSWVIHTRPSDEQIAVYVEAGASFLLIDPGEDECLARAEADGRPESTADVIRDWYANPPVLPDGYEEAEAMATVGRDLMRQLQASARAAGARRDWVQMSIAGDEASLYIYDEIGYWGTDAQGFVDALNRIDADTIDLYINSPGGDAWAGTAIYTALRRHKARVKVTVDGIAASAASLIAMAGDEIVMSLGSQMMIHDASGYAYGDAAALRSGADMLDSTSSSYADVYATRGGDAATWREAMKATTWYSASEAVAAGLADRVDSTPTETDPKAAYAAFVAAHAGRTAPPPVVPVAAHNPPVSSEPGQPNRRESSMPLESLLAGLRERLGMTEANADEAAILARLDEALAQAANPAPPALPAGVVTIEAAVLADLQASAAEVREIRAEQATARRSGLVEAAIKDGRIPPARRDHWTAQLAADEVGMTAILASLSPVVPLEEIGRSDGPDSADAAAYDKAWGTAQKEA